MYEYIKANWEEIQSRVAVAARKAGIKPEEVAVVAVSKLFPAGSDWGCGSSGDKRYRREPRAGGRTEN